MSETLRILRIFLASPSDVAAERAKVETVAYSLKPTADALGLSIEIVDWRQVVPDAGRPQQVIFDQLKPTSWDIFVGILWHRFGTPSGAIDLNTGKEYLSGTEEEFSVAYNLHKEYSKPQIIIYQCTRAIPYDADLLQMQTVKDFFKKIQDPTNSKTPVFTQSFDTVESFERLWSNNLQKILADYGEVFKMPIPQEIAHTFCKSPNNLPRRSAFFGRFNEIESVIRALSPSDRTWGVLIDGIGGIGKTALAIESGYIAHERDMFDAFIFVSAKENFLTPGGIRQSTTPANTLDAFLNETCYALGQPGISKLTGEEKLRVLLDALRQSRVLLIYDNLETLSKEEQEAMADFLRMLPQNCKAIITSRRRGGEGGFWLRLEKIDYDAACRIIENEISREAGLAKKMQYLKAQWPRLYDETKGSPLALVHILGLLRVRVSLTFEGAIAMLQGNANEDLQKFVFQEARKELTSNDKIALGSLSFFTPSASFDAWMQVANLSRNALETTIDRLSALSLVDVLSGDELFSLHPLTRAYINEDILKDLSIRNKISSTFVDYWVEFARKYGGVKYENYKTFSLLESNWGNLIASLDLLWDAVSADFGFIDNKSAADDYDILVKLLKIYMHFSGRWDELVVFCTQAYNIMVKFKQGGNAVWHAVYVAFIYFCRKQTDDAEKWAQNANYAASLKGSKHDYSGGMRMMGKVAEQRGEYQEAERLYKETMNIVLELGKEHDVVILYNDLGFVEQLRARYKVSENYYRRALNLARQIDSKPLATKCFGNLGDLYRCLDDWNNSYKSHQEELELAEEVGRIDFLAHAQFGLALFYEKTGEKIKALSYVEEALVVYNNLRIEGLKSVQELVSRLK